MIVYFNRKNYYIFLGKMIINTYLRHNIRIITQLNSCVFCSQPQNPITLKRSKKPRRTPSEKHLKEIQDFIEQNPGIVPYRQIIPTDILKRMPRNPPPHLYLICPDIANKIAKCISERCRKNQFMAEANPGLGLISECLLKSGFKNITLFELNVDFHKYLQNKYKTSQKKIIVHRKDFFSLKRYLFMDKMDKGERIDSMFENLPKRSWSEMPFLTVIGTMTKRIFLEYLIKSIILQNDLAQFGRFDLFLLTYHNYWNNIKGMQIANRKLTWNYLFKTFYDVEYIDKYPREYFIPWQSQNDSKRDLEFDFKHIYLVRVCMKKELPIPATDFVQFFCFLMYLYRHGTGSVIRTCEKWLPNCGESLLLPELNHSDYYEDLNVFTKFKDLNFDQTLALFKEFSNHPNFSNSPFMDMLEVEWMKSETIETTLNEAFTKKTM